MSETKRFPKERLYLNFLRIVYFVLQNIFHSWTFLKLFLTGLLLYCLFWCVYSFCPFLLWYASVWWLLCCLFNLIFVFWFLVFLFCFCFVFILFLGWFCFASVLSILFLQCVYGCLISVLSVFVLFLSIVFL
jgi:hypothetical protein